ncbi:uncharacterized protein EV154DRAFT_444474, partial [Mucor mucedo]|uniref:uncharacterized protein n=1 Tax=Mucor mucedo TaxID=29922 RepID=UPI00221E64A6
MKYIDICSALYDYQAQSKEEISFQAQDILYILDKSDVDWYKAQLKVQSLDGPTGLIPANYLEKAAPLGTVTAVYDYTAQSLEELSFKENEVLTLYEKDDTDWFVVQNSKSEFGLAPGNYVQEDIPAVKDTVKETKRDMEPRWAIALFSYQPQSDEDTFLEDNQQVLVTDYTGKDWWTIEHKDGKAGIVPANYLKFQDVYEAELKAEQEREQERLQAHKEQEQKQLEQKRQKDLADRKNHREQQDKEKERQLEVERRRKMQEEAKQKEIESKRQASFSAAAAAASAAANVIPSPQLGSPRRSQIPAPPPPTKADIPQHNDPNKPDPSRIRMWTDRTGAFKVEAEFLSCANGKIRLFKTNGVKIDVPTQKMCMEDLLYIQSETGQDLIQHDDIPLGQLKVGFTWLDYFKKTRLPHYACVQYAKSFEKSGLGEHDVERLTHRRMKSLGMSERHVQRIQRFIETNRAEPPSEDENEQPKKVKKHVTFGAVSYIVENDDDNDGEEDEGSVLWQIEQDERLARQLQEQDHHAGGLQRRGTGRPTPAQSAPRGVNSAVLTPQKFNPEPLKPTPPLPQQQPLQPVPNAPPALPKFEDDAWAPRSSPSTAPSTAPTWNQASAQTPPTTLAASRQRPTPPVPQQSLVDPQLLAKWGGSPSLAAANSRPVPPPPTVASSPLHQPLNSLPTQQQPTFHQQPSNSSFSTLQSNNSFVTAQSTPSFAPTTTSTQFPPAQPTNNFVPTQTPNNFASPQQQLTTGNSFQQPTSAGSFTSTNFQHQLPTGNSFQNQAHTGNSFQQQPRSIQNQTTGLQHQASGLQQVNVNSYQLPNHSGSFSSSLPQTSFQHQLPTSNGSFSSLQTGNTNFQQPANFQQQHQQQQGYAAFNHSPSMQSAYLGVQAQPTGASWAAATPANPFGGASPSPSYQQLPPQNNVPQYNNTIDPNDKYSVFKTVDTTT